MESFLAQMTNGLIIGCIYGLMALGLTLIFGVLKIINFAHGEFYMLGAYISYMVSQMIGISPIISIKLNVKTSMLYSLHLDFRSF
jgi:branched-chain amino acid transport system permease protein